jgi:hypothetical protein
VSRGIPEGVPKYLAAWRQVKRACRLVDSELQPREELPDMTHDPFARAVCSHVYAAIIRISNEAVSSLLQLPIHAIEQHVGQKG